LGPESGESGGLVGEQRTPALHQHIKKQDDQVRGIQPEKALLEKNDVVLGVVVFLMQDQGHIESRDHIEALHGKIAVNKAKSKNGPPVHVLGQDGDREEKPEKTHNGPSN
jgi:hypothetical protein